LSTTHTPRERRITNWDNTARIRPIAPEKRAMSARTAKRLRVLKKRITAGIKRKEDTRTNAREVKDKIERISTWVESRKC